MSTDATNKGSSFAPLTFDASASPGEAACSMCKAPLRGSYHTVNDAVTCANCRYSAEAKHGAGAFPRALLFGAGAAVAGAIGYYAFVRFTGVEWGLITGLVGIGVGQAVRIGSRNRGGRNFQILALALAYLAMSGAYSFFGRAEVDIVTKITALATIPLYVAMASPISGLIMAFALLRAWKQNAGVASELRVGGPFRLGTQPGAA